MDTTNLLDDDNASDMTDDSTHETGEQQESSIHNLERMIEKYSTTFSSYVNAALTEDQSKLIFFVKYLALPDNVDVRQSFMRVDNEDEYKAACDKVFSMHAFPVKGLKEDKIYREEFINMNRIALAVRIRRLLLYDDREKARVYISRLEELISKCIFNINLLGQRLSLLEVELDYLKDSSANDDPSDSSTTRFCALLKNNLGFTTIAKIIVQHISNIKTISKTNATQITHSMIQSSYLAWDLLQYWHLLYSVRMRIRKGERDYPVRLTAANRKIALKTRKYTENWTPIRERMDILRNSHTVKEDELFVFHEFIVNSQIKSAVHATGNLGDIYSVGNALGAEGKTLYAILQAVVQLLKGPTLREVVPEDTVREVSGLVDAFKEKADEAAKAQMLHALALVVDDVADEIQVFLGDVLRKAPEWDEMLSTLRRERTLRAGGQILVRNGAEVETNRYGDIKVSVPLASGFVDTDIFHAQCYGDGIQKSLRQLFRLHSNDFMYLLPGTPQRIDASIALLEAQTALIDNRDRYTRVAGELACVVQYGYESSVVYLQRFFRKILARKISPPLLRDLVYRAMSASVVTIQSWYRKLRQVWAFRAMKADWLRFLLELSATLIQAQWRGYIQRKRYLAQLDEWRRIRRERAATKIQKMIRSFLARRFVDKLRRQLLADKLQTMRRWAATTIQKRIRGYIVRSAVIRSLKIRKHLSKDVLRLAGKYLNSGDMWGFLQDVDREFVRLYDELDTMKKQEDTYAKTFVEKVLVKRRAEYDGAWDSFSQVLSTNGKHEREKDYVETNVLDKNPVDDLHHKDEFLSSIAPPTAMTMSPNSGSTSPGRKGKDWLEKYTSTRTPVSPIRSTKSVSTGSLKRVPKQVMSSTRQRKKEHKLDTISTESQYYETVYQPGNSNAAPIPGMMLRRAISATVKDRLTAVLEKSSMENRKLEAMEAVYLGVDNQQSLSNSSIFSSSSIPLMSSSIESSMTLSSASASLLKKSSKHPKKKSKTNTTKKRGMMTNANSSVHPSSQHAHASPSASVSSSASPHRRSSPGRVKLSRSSLLSDSDSVLTSPARSTSSSSRQSSRRSKIREVFTWVAPANDEYRPMAEPLTADSFPNLGGPPAFHGDSLLIDIPLGLKDSLERLIRAAAVRSFVPDFLPNMSPDAAYKVYQNMPPGLARVRFEGAAWSWSQPIIEKLRSKGIRNISDLLPPSKLAMYMRDTDAPTILNESCVKICVELKRVGVIALGMAHKPTIRKVNKVLGTGGEYYSKGARAKPPSPPPTPPPPVEKVDEYPEDKSAVLSSEEEVRNLMSLVMGADDSWKRMGADCDELLQRAAYFVCRHIPISTWKQPGYVDDMAGELGPGAFHEHLAEVCRLVKPEHKKEAIRHRVKMASDLIYPYLLSLKANGIITVRDLVQTDLHKYGIPLPLKEQIEALLTIAVSCAVDAKMAVNSKTFPQNRKSKTKAAKLSYDPRYQRSPFDPCGAPPRVESLDSLVKSKKKVKQKNLEDSTRATMEVLARKKVPVEEPFDVVPGGLWSRVDGFEEEQDDAFQIGNSLVHGGGSTTQFGKNAGRNSVGMSNSSSKHLYSSGRSFVGGEDDARVDSEAGARGVEQDEIRLGSTWLVEEEEEDGKADVIGEEHEDRGGEMDIPGSSVSMQRQQMQSRSSKSRGDSRKSTSNRERGKDSAVQRSTSEEVWLWRQQLRTSSDNTGVALGRSLTADKPSSAEPVVTARQVEPPRPFIPPGFTMANEFGCSHLGCGQVFSRAYTLKVHEKSHDLFSDYHEYKVNPKLFLDSDQACVVAEHAQRLAFRAALPPLIQRDLENIQRKAATNASGLGNLV